MQLFYSFLYGVRIGTDATPNCATAAVLLLAAFSSNYFTPWSIECIPNATEGVSAFVSIVLGFFFASTR